MIVPQNPTYAYVGVFVDEVARAGVSDVVICPGSRSTPLTLVFAAEERIRKWVLVDERSAAFFALGLAKQSNRPVALVCTSGTAAANFLPAVAEAQQGRVPLLVLTTDRPPELQGVGAPQTMGQTDLYGEHVKWFEEMALPESTPAMLRYSRTMALRAVDKSQGTPYGPVHLNFPFREPLVNPPPESGFLYSAEDELARDGRREGLPLTRVERTTPGASVAYAVGSEIPFANSPRGLIIAGPRATPTSDDAGFETGVMRLAEIMQYPILADPLSGLRRLAHPLVIDSYEAFLRNPDFVTRAAPEITLRFGGMPTSKPLLQYLQAHASAEHVLIEETEEWRDPAQVVSRVIRANDAAFVADVAARSTPRDATDWTRLWQITQRRSGEAIRRTVDSFEALFEGRVFTELAHLLPERSTLVVGNSMPIRDCDAFFPATDRSISIMGNRGVNGIDGMISTALGIAAGQREPTVLVVGDLTFYHDLNGLLAAKKYGLDLTIVLINNDGGGIFSFLPQAEHHAEHFEAYFGTPTGLDFSFVTQMYGGSFTRIREWDAFRDAVRRGITEGGLHVVEVPTDREQNVVMHRQVWKAVNDSGQWIVDS